MTTSTDLLGDSVRPKLGIGYAGTPGRGPKDQSCGTCDYCVRQGRMLHRSIFKCGHILAYRSNSAASDIRKGTPACEHWEKREPD